MTADFKKSPALPKSKDGAPKISVKGQARIAYGVAFFAGAGAGVDGFGAAGAEDAGAPPFTG